LYSYVLRIVVDVLSMDQHIDAVVGELVHPYVVRNVTAVWF